MAEEEKTAPEEEILTPEEQKQRDERRKVTEKNYDILSQLEHRTVHIKTNRYEDEDREYYVEEVERFFLDGSSGYIPSVRLVNDSVRPSLQPILQMPRGPIPVKTHDGRTELHLVYSREPSIEHSFHYMNRHERPDLEIYISFEA